MRQEPVDLDALDLVEATTRVLETYLPAGATSIVSLSTALGISTRSLQRRLAEAGTSHTQLLEAVRRKAALARLQQPGYPITEIARELGYSDAAHFTRAFGRWFGVPPRRLRRLRARGE